MFLGQGPALEGMRRVQASFLVLCLGECHPPICSGYNQLPDSPFADRTRGMYLPSKGQVQLQEVGPSKPEVCFVLFSKSSYQLHKTYMVWENLESEAETEIQLNESDSLNLYNGLAVCLALCFSIQTPALTH